MNMYIRIICDKCRKELEIVDESNERDDWWETDITDTEPTHVIRVEPCEHCSRENG